MLDVVTLKGVISTKQRLRKDIEKIIKENRT